MTTCPVCGKTVEEAEAPYSVYNGQIYYFACPDCKARFDEDPERYITMGPKSHGGYSGHCH
ncbi:MAG: YHS domain-containing protein [Armatimonadota bacterium]|nr:YHS domain-containing protein [Armatimonadota bacterium]